MATTRRAALFGVWSLSAMAAVRAQQPSVAVAVGAGALEATASVLSRTTALLDALAVGLAKVGPRTIRKFDRTRVRSEIDAAVAAMTQLRMSQMQFLGDLDDYLRGVRETGFDEKRHGRLWRFAISQIRELTDKVGDLIGALRAAEWLSLVLTPQQRIDLDVELAARLPLLARLAEMEPPRSEGDLFLVERLHARYSALSASLVRVAAALRASSDRLGAE
jgi:hypothetical protein